MKYKALVIGCGNIGSLYSEKISNHVLSHAHALKIHPSIELVGLIEPNPSRLSEASKFWNTRGFANLSDFSNNFPKDNVDIISICTPVESHFEITNNIIEKKLAKIIILEKPLAESTTQAKALVENSTKLSVPILVNYSRRFSSVFQSVGELIKNGEYNDLEFFRILYGKGLSNNGSHAIDLCRYWFGEIDRIISVTKHPYGLDSDATVSCIFQMKSGLIVDFSGINHTHLSVFEGDLLTTSHRIEFRVGGSVWRFWEREEIKEYPQHFDFKESKPNPSISLNQPMSDCLVGLIKNAVDFLDNKTELICSGQEALTTLTWVEKIKTLSQT